MHGDGWYVVCRTSVNTKVLILERLVHARGVKQVNFDGKQSSLLQPVGACNLKAFS